MNLKYKVNGLIHVIDIINLRNSLGWTKNEKKYANLLHNSFCYIVCYDDNKVVGLINVISNYTTDAYIQDLMVLPPYQRKGIGSKLIELAIAYIQKNDISSITLVFEEKLRSFYEKFGFKIQLSGRISAD